MDTRKVTLGAALLLVSTVIMFASGSRSFELPLFVVAAAAIGLAAATLLLGTSGHSGPRV